MTVAGEKETKPHPVWGCRFGGLA